MKKGIFLYTFVTRCLGIFIGTFWSLNSYAVGVFLPILPGGSLSDTSYEKYVSKSTPLRDRYYEPPDLTILSGSLLIDTAGRYVYLRKDTKDTLLELASEFYREFARPLVIISGYRSFEYQKRLWDQGKCSETLCAPPGYSEHQLGLAIDIFEATTEADIMANRAFARYLDWMRSHAHLYGWTESYQRGEYVDAYQPEPWHWRYVGKSLATELKHLDMTLTEYTRFTRAMEYMGFGPNSARGYMRFIVYEPFL